MNRQPSGTRCGHPYDVSTPSISRPCLRGAFGRKMRQETRGDRSTPCYRKERPAMQGGVNSIAIQGIDLQVVRQGTGRPLLLLHGGDGPHAHLPFFTRLAGRFEVIAPTHPGFAGTAIPEHFDTLEDLVYLYLDLLDVLDLHEVILMSMAMGSWVVAEIAVRNTSRLS